MKDESGREGGPSPEASGSWVPVDDWRSWPYAVLLLGVTGAFLVAVRPVLSPLVLYGLFLYLAWPLTGTGTGRRLTGAVTVLFLLWVVEATGLLLAPFVLAVLLAYILGPAVDWLQSRGVSRPAGIGLLALPLLGLLAVAVLVLAPAVGRQVTQLIANVPEYVDVVEGWVGEVRAWVVGLGIAGVDEQTVPTLQDLDPQAIAGYLQRWQSQIVRGGGRMVLGLGRGIGTTVTLVGYLVLTPLLTYYLLRDWNAVRRALRGLVPEDRRRLVGQLAAEYDGLLSRYLRGQLLLALAVGVTVAVGFWALDFPYALLLGLVAGAFNLVPYMGLVFGVAAAVVVALFTGPVLTGLLKVAVVFGVEQLVEGVAGPYIVGGSVGLHPVWVILALVLCGFFFGFVGLLVAVPLAVLVKLALREGLQRYRSRAGREAPGT